MQNYEQKTIIYKPMCFSIYFGNGDKCTAII